MESRHDLKKEEIVNGKYFDVIAAGGTDSDHHLPCKLHISLDQKEYKNNYRQKTLLINLLADAVSRGEIHSFKYTNEKKIEDDLRLATLKPEEAQRLLEGDQFTLYLLPHTDSNKLSNLCSIIESIIQNTKSKNELDENIKFSSSESPISQHISFRKDCYAESEIDSLFSEEIRKIRLDSPFLDEPTKIRIKVLFDLRFSTSYTPSDRRYDPKEGKAIPMIYMKALQTNPNAAKRLREIQEGNPLFKALKENLNSRKDEISNLDIMKNILMGYIAIRAIQDENYHKNRLHRSFLGGLFVANIPTRINAARKLLEVLSQDSENTKVLFTTSELTASTQGELADIVMTCKQLGLVSETLERLHAKKNDIRNAI